MSEPIEGLPATAPAAPNPPRPPEVTPAPEAAAPTSAPRDTDGGSADRPPDTGAKKRRRGSRGGRNRKKKPSATPAGGAAADGPAPAPVARTGADAARSDVARAARPARPARPADDDDRAAPAGSAEPPAAPEAVAAGPAPAGASDRKPRIGDSRPAPPPPPPPRTRAAAPAGPAGAAASRDGDSGPKRRRRRRGGRSRTTAAPSPVRAVTGERAELDDDVFERRRGRERKGRPVGRYLMAVHVRPDVTQVAILEGRALIEHYVSRPADDVFEIMGNIYLGRVQNVLPGMEAAFVDIGTPKNAVLYRGDVQYDRDDIEESSPRIEHLLRNGQTVLCQVTKNPIGAKGARLTTEVSLPGRFVVLVPNSRTFGISKRLSDDERRRLRGVLDRARPAHHGVIVRTAAEGVTAEEIERDVARLVSQWDQIEALAKRSKAPALLYREPDLAVRVIREEFNANYRGIVIDDERLFGEVHDYVESVAPELAERVEHYDTTTEPLPLYERFHVHEQLHKALDRKVWLPSGGSVIIERTEALTVIDVNTGKNVGRSSLEETVFQNNLEAAEEIARQLRLRDIGGIIVIDFIDMEIIGNRGVVVRAFRDALSRDKTRTQVFDISELGLVEMTRKRIGEGLVESLSSVCPNCEGRGLVLDGELLEL